MTTPENQPTPEPNDVPYGAPLNYPTQPGAASQAPLPGAAGADPAASAPAGSRRRRGRTVAVVAGVAAVVLVGGGVGGAALVAHAMQRGAGSAQDVVTRLDAAVRDKKALELGKLVSPAELRPFMEDLTALGKDSGLDQLHSSSSVPFGKLDTESLDELLDSITIRSSTMDFSVSEKSSTIAVATVNSWKLDASVDKAALVDAAVHAQERAGAKDTDGVRTRLQDALKDRKLSYHGDVAAEGKGSSRLLLGLVKEDGRWYLSPAVTAAETAYRASDPDPSAPQPAYGADVEGAAGADSATGAVTSLVEKLSSVSSPSQLLEPGFASLLSLPERRLLMIYGPTLGDGSSPDAGSSQLFEAEWKLSEHRVNDELAIVNPGSSVLTLDGDSTRQLRFDGARLTLGDTSIDAGRLLADPERLGVAAVRENGTWHVSVLDTLTNLFTLRGNDEGVAKAEELFASLPRDLELNWDDVDERNRAILGGLMSFVDVGEQLSGESLSEAIGGAEDALGGADPFGDGSFGSAPFGG